MNTSLKVLRITARAAAFTLAALLLLLGLALTWTWDHRRQIRAALVAGYAALVVAVELTLAAGRSTRQAIDRAGAELAPVLQVQPGQAIEAARARLEAWVSGLYATARKVNPQLGLFSRMALATDQRLR